MQVTPPWTYIENRRDETVEKEKTCALEI